MSTKPTREDFVKAMEEMDSYLDITPEDLMILNERATHNARLRTLRDIPIGRFMTREVVTVSPDVPVAQAALLMLRHHIAGMPVVTAAGELVGVLTEADLLAAVGLPRHQPHHSIWQTLESIFSPDTRVDALSGSVAELMVRDVITLDANATLGDAITTMARHAIKRVIVTGGNGTVAGIVTRSNLIRAFLETLAQSSGD